MLGPHRSQYPPSFIAAHPTHPCRWKTDPLAPRIRPYSASPDPTTPPKTGPIRGATGGAVNLFHDLTAARIWGILRELAAAGLIVLADKGYYGAGQHIRTCYRGRMLATRASPAQVL